MKDFDDDKVTMHVIINRVVPNGLLDTGAKCNDTSETFANRACVKKQINLEKLDLAVNAASVTTTGFCAESAELLDLRNKRDEVLRY